MASVSVCVLSDGEVMQLVRCLTPLSDFADEVLVCDANDSREVRERADAFGARYIPPKGNTLDAIQNALIQHASKEYVLFLYSSEVIFKHKVARLKQFLDDDDADAYIFSIRQYTNQKNAFGFRPSTEMGGFEGYVAAKRVVLWRNVPKIKFEGAVAASLIPALVQSQKKIKEVTDIVVHDAGDALASYRLGCAKRALESDPEDINAMYVLARMLMETDVQRAKELFEKVYEKDETYKKVGSNLASIYVQIGDTKRAAELYKKIIENNPQNAGAYHNLGQLFRKAKLLDKAEFCFRKALSVRKDDPRLYRVLAITYQEQGATQKAKAALDTGYQVTRDESLKKLYEKL